MNIQTDWYWSSHQPLIKAVMSYFEPKFVLELGVGDFSTPIFQQYPAYLLSVENDSDWAKFIAEKYNHDNIIYHDLDNIGIHSPASVLTHLERVNINLFYDELNIYQKAPRLLFVDHFTSIRTLAINNLYSEFDFIIYHDCEPQGVTTYDYDKFIISPEYKSYTLKCNGTWTGLLTKRDIKDLPTRISRYIEEYKAVNVGCEWMEFSENK